MCVLAGLPRPHRAARRHLLRGRSLHLRAQCEDVREAEHLDLLRVLRHLPRSPHRHQLLRRIPPQTPVEPGRLGNDLHVILFIHVLHIL